MTNSPIIFILLGLIIFFVLREFWCWYFKINKITRILERIERNTRKEGQKYPDEEYDEEYFIRNNIKIPDENTEVGSK